MPARRPSASGCKEFYEQTLFSRLNDKQNGAIIAIQQRLHEDDLAGYLLAKGNFTHLELKAIAEADERHAIGNGRVYRRQQGRGPVPGAGAARRARGDPQGDRLRRILRAVPAEPGAARWQSGSAGSGSRPTTSAPRASFFQMVVQSWDTAVTAEPKSDFSVCTTWGYPRGQVVPPRCLSGPGSSIRTSSAR